MKMPYRLGSLVAASGLAVLTAAMPAYTQETGFYEQINKHRDRVVMLRGEVAVRESAYMNKFHQLYLKIINISQGKTMLSEEDRAFLATLVIYFSKNPVVKCMELGKELLTTESEIYNEMRDVIGDPEKEKEEKVLTLYEHAEKQARGVLYCIDMHQQILDKTDKKIKEMEERVGLKKHI